MRTSTGHGLAQMVKPDNLFLSLLWVVFFLIGVGGGIFMIHQSVEEFSQYGVITTTKIVREKELIMPAITLCSKLNTRDSMMYGNLIMTDFTLYDELGERINCVQINHGTNVTELKKATGVNDHLNYGFVTLVYIHSESSFRFGITENSAKVVYGNMNNDIYPGQMTEIALSKTVQTALGQPHSDCSEVEDYMQVNCRDDCFIKKMTEICGCAYPAECELHSDWTEKCKEGNEKKDSIRSQCSLTCPVECNQVNFEVDRMDIEWTSLIWFDVKPYKTKVSKSFNISGMTDDQFKKRLTLISIFFRKLETTKITQSPSMTLTSLVANVGGLLGKSLYYFLKNQLH